eukprot:c19628_g2_i2.p2 GENE.c19628_g2_i2~~c19628_g2_i2.p2  ORF type:complete len:129 (+),score=16.75 c19628_g2_i2:3-389(+)
MGGILWCLQEGFVMSSLTASLPPHPTPNSSLAPTMQPTSHRSIDPSAFSPHMQGVDFMANYHQTQDSPMQPSRGFGGVSVEQHIQPLPHPHPHSNLLSRHTLSSAPAPPSVSMFGWLRAGNPTHNGVE